MIGCSSHRMNLAMQALMEEHDDLLEKVHRLMTKFNTIKNRHYLRKADALMPVFHNVIRLSSTFAMVDRYFAIYSNLDRVDDELADFIPNPRENVCPIVLYEDLKNLESVNKKLQTATLTLLDVRALFDHVINHYPTTKTHLAASATLVKFPDFENGIVKVIAGKERSLTRAERSAVAKLCRPTVRSQGASESCAKKRRGSAPLLMLHLWPRQPLLLKLICDGSRQLRMMLSACFPALVLSTRVYAEA
ncbi:hypothetical protein PI124_g397 [Phytophthora idaei]|nr:hypothetical protein PI125_g1283 [Phytophthora idaei]KAG3150591.1 hypothetical protein PI126_g11432 [Phytophthora idaei]KAG3255055.1 hypothetical protein PI124_g397 [Phytophthora idaei]